MTVSHISLLTVFALIFVCINPSIAAVPVAQFTATPTLGESPLTVAFNDTSTGSPTGWAWYFGDENFTEPWTLVNASAGWTPRFSHSCVVMPDGSIVLMGGRESDIGNYMNDVWRSTDNGSTWTLVNASAGWTPRYSHTSVVMEDSSIVLMGGYSSTGNKNDVWRSTDNGSTWTLVNASAGWTAGYYHSSVAMPDGSIVLMGGYSEGGGGYKNDVWRSTDNGSTWTLVNASAGWSARDHQKSVVLPDGSIILMGGYSGIGYKNDVWRSTDKGTSWTQVNASAGWIERAGHSSVAMPDGSIVLMGGYNSGIGSLNDVWRSTDKGTSWTQVNASAAWSTRHNHIMVVIPDGSIILIGGQEFGGKILNDVWRFVPTGSSGQNPFHTYNNIGIFPVTLQVYNIDGYNSTRKTGFINVIPPISKIAVYRNGVWIIDKNHNFSWDGTLTDKLINFSNRPITSGDMAVNGDWNGDGKTEAGVYDGFGTWYLDYNGNGNYDGAIVDRTANIGGVGNHPVIGDWDGTGKDKIGVEKDGFWAIDYNGNFVWDGAVTDRFAAFGQTSDIPVIGDWNGDGKDEIGSHKDGFWAIDYNGNYVWNGAVTDRFAGFGLVADIPVIGDWDGTGKDKIGMEKDGFWATDYDGNYLWDGAVIDKFAGFGQAGDIPVVGDWNLDGKAKIGSFKDGFWAIDYNGNYVWDGAVTDRFAGFGQTGDIPVAGKWS